MCPPLSCCHGRSATPLSDALHCLLRLLIGPDEAATDADWPEAAALQARQDALWDALHAGLRAHYCTTLAHAQELAEQLLTHLLGEECCRQALVRLVPLAQALGPAWTAAAVAA